MQHASTFPLVVAAFTVASGTAANGFQDTYRVSVDSSGAEGNSWSDNSSISADGRFVVFTSDATNLVPGDANGARDVFVRDLQNLVTERVSVSSAGAEANGVSVTYYGNAISGDGARVVFLSHATNLVANDTNGYPDIFLRDRTAGTTQLLTVDAAGQQASALCEDPVISADGKFVAFASYANTFVPFDTNGEDVFVRDLAAGTLERVSVDSSGVEGDQGSKRPALSSDGRYVAFYSEATNLVAGDTNAVGDVFLHDRTTGTTERVSVDSSGNQGNDRSLAPSVSGDGSLVAFESVATNLVASDTNGWRDVFLHVRATGITTLISVDSAGTQGNRDSSLPFLFPDGSSVAFSSLAWNLVADDFNNHVDAFVHDVAAGTTTRISLNSAGDEANGDTRAAGVAADGNRFAMNSFASDLVSSDNNGGVDCFVHQACNAPASWTNYGAGVPGTNGVPSFTATQFPTFGATISIVLDNSYGAPTSGLLALGLQRGNFKTKFGGDLLVTPLVIVPITFSFGADTFTGTILDDAALCGVTLDLQGIEVDPGAVKGMSFSQGLELLIGN